MKWKCVKFETGITLKLNKVKIGSKLFGNSSNAISWIISPFSIQLSTENTENTEIEPRVSLFNR